jgi:CBS domain-containing protein
MVEVNDETPLLTNDTTVDAAKLFLDQRECNSWPVGSGKFVHALINRRDLEGAGAKPTPGTLLDVIDSDAMYPYVHADHPVSYALERMRENGTDVLPVVSRAGIHNIIGVIGLREILESYGVPTANFFSRSTPA